MIDVHSRRTFLRAALAAGSAWAAADLVLVEDALAHAAQQATEQGRRTFAALTAGQARVLEAMTSRILPSVDGRPGAREAGVVYFVDQSLATFNAGNK